MHGKESTKIEFVTSDCFLLQNGQWLTLNNLKQSGIDRASECGRYLIHSPSYECVRMFVPCLLCESAAHEETYGWSCRRQRPTSGPPATSTSECINAEDTMVPRGCLLCESAAHEETYGWSCPTCRARLCGVCRAQMHKARESNP